MESERLVLFDTDIGNDIDDAVALAYLLNEPRCRLLGVTTVTGDTARRAALAEVVCRAAGREDIPIHAGLTGPLLHGPGQPQVPQYAAIADLPHRLDYPAGAALPFLRETIRAHPGQVTLLAVGPMTNVGALFASDPELPGLLQEIVLMCGVFTAASGQGPGAREWNAMVDPVATALTMKHGAGRLLSVGLDVTMPCVLERDVCRRRFAAAGGALAQTLALAEVWFEQVPHITFHDPLAATLLFEPDLCGYETGVIDAVVEAGPLEGLTRWRRDPAGPYRIATTVDPARFFAHYFSVTGG